MSFIGNPFLFSTVPLGLTLIDPGAWQGTDANGITSNSISPTANSHLITAQASRHTNSRTHLAPTVSGLTMASPWTQIEAFSVIDTDAAAYVHGSLWWAIVASGTGTISQTANGNTFQRILSVIQIVGAPSSLLAQPARKNTHEEGTSLAAMLDNVPALSSLGLAFMASRVNDPAISSPSGYSSLWNLNPFGGGLQSTMYYKLGSPSQTVTYANLVDDIARGLINVEVAD